MKIGDHEETFYFMHWRETQVVEAFPWVIFKS